MKSINISAITSAIALFILFTSMTGITGDPSEKDDSEKNCLEVVGIALDQKEVPIDGVQVTLFRENDELEWVEVTSVIYHEHSFFFSLDANEYYTIEVSKPGYVSRSIGISTRIPDDISLKPKFRYEFEVALFKEKKGVDDYYLDFPVALISYNPRNDVFDNNNNYTKHIKTKIKESINEVSGIRTRAK